jgi:hypothetical protein
MSYHKAKRASQSEKVYAMSLTRDDIMKLGFHDLNTYTYERRIRPTQLGGQLWGTRDSFLPTRALSFDNSVRSSLDVIRHSRPSSSYNRRYDPTESALRALPYGTGRYRANSIAITSRPHPRIHVCTATLCKRVDNRAIRPHTAGSRLVANAFAYLVEHEDSRNSSSSLSDAPLTTTSSNSKPFNLMRPLRGSTNCCENGIWFNC